MTWHQRLDAVPHWHMGKHVTKCYRWNCWSMINERFVPACMREGKKTSFWTCAKLKLALFTAINSRSRKTRYVLSHFHHSYLKANKVSKSKGARKVEYAYHFWKCADAVYPELSKLVCACRNYSLLTLVHFWRQCINLPFQHTAPNDGKVQWGYLTLLKQCLNTSHTHTVQWHILHFVEMSSQQPAAKYLSVDCSVQHYSALLRRHAHQLHRSCWGRQLLRGVYDAYPSEQRTSTCWAVDHISPLNNKYHQSIAIGTMQIPTMSKLNLQVTTSKHIIHNLTYYKSGILKA